MLLCCCAVLRLCRGEAEGPLPEHPLLEGEPKKALIAAVRCHDRLWHLNTFNILDLSTGTDE